MVSRSGHATQVAAKARDESGRAYEPLAWAVGPGETVHFNSHDLEVGNFGKGLAGSTGPGEGDWWLELSSDWPVDVFAYIRTADGFLTAMHDVVASADGSYWIATFSPGSNRSQQSSPVRVPSALVSRVSPKRDACVPKTRRACVPKMKCSLRGS